MSVVKITLPIGEVPVNGKQISFIAPCSCANTEALEIDGVQYTVVDSRYKIVTGYSAWTQGAIVSVILNVDKKCAFIQNGSAVPLTRTINDKPLSDDIVLSAADVNAITYYKDLSELGVAKGSETMSTIAKAMPDHSELWLMINTADGYNSAKDVYPVSSGTLIIRRRESRRVTCDFYPTTTADANSIWYGYANGSTGFFSGWKEQKDADSLFGTHNKPSGTYLGTGEARDPITIGGVGNVLAIWNLHTADTATGPVTETHVAFVTPLGMVGNIYYAAGDCKMVSCPSDLIKFENGVLTFGATAITENTRNAAGVTYYYQIL